MARYRYREEGVDVETIKYTDNIAVVELIAGRADSLMGALTEECIFPKGSDGSYAEKVKKVHSKHAHFNDMKTEPTAFAVRHFAGEVVYEVDGFLAKNKDPISQARRCSTAAITTTSLQLHRTTTTTSRHHYDLPSPPPPTSQDLLVLLQHSGDAWLSSLMKEHPKAAAAADSSRSGGGAASSKLKERGKLKGLKSAKFVGVVDHFQTSPALRAHTPRNSGAILAQFWRF